MYAQTAYPYEVGRREIVQLGAGLLPTSWSLMVSSDAEKLPLYMDVSGSMTSWYPFIPGSSNTSRNGSPRCVSFPAL
jgi:hypothetical protein